MKKYVLLAILSLFLSAASLKAQSFNENSDVIAYMDGRAFYNSENGLNIELQYLPTYNTYGLVLTNGHDNTTYLINVKVSCYGAFADISAERIDDGAVIELSYTGGSWLPVRENLINKRFI
jgi:hypothetical protein